eukprot:scaffold46315_cov18-Tisochrysis_lutea.AAC.1
MLQQTSKGSRGSTLFPTIQDYDKFFNVLPKIPLRALTSANELAILVLGGSSCLMSVRLDMGPEEDPHTLYLSLVEEAQSPASNNLTELLENITKSDRWHTLSKENARTALRADKSQLMRMAEGLDALGVKAAGARLLASNRLLFSIAPGQHQTRARNTITRCIASLELARREAERAKGSKEWLELSFSAPQA